MDFKVEKKKSENKKKHTKEDIDIAYEFAKEAYKEFGTFLKAIVLFGSNARKTKRKSNDIDILLIVDDVTIYLTPEIIETYKIILERLLGKMSRKLHITTLRFTSFWDLVRNGDPVIINIMRDGFPIIDTGVFEPLQRLLVMGKIRPTEESIWTYFSRAPTTLHNSKWHILQGTMDLYWAVIDAAHAALMKQGEMPPSPEHISGLLMEKLVKKGLLKKKYANTMQKFYDLYKGIAHRSIKEISGSEFETYYKEAEAFVKEMQKFIKDNPKD